MNQGFFVVLLKVSGKPSSRWRANVLRPVKGWVKTTGETMQDAMNGQKDQYFSQAAQQLPIPELVDEKDFPQAIGQAIRFISLTTAKSG
jgi:hypothetical protein